MTSPNPLCQLLPWDSSFFGIKIAQSNVERLTSETVKNIESWCRRQQVRCLYLLADASDPITIQLAEDHHFHLVDIRLTMDLNLRDIEDHFGNFPAFTIRPAQPADTHLLEEIAVSSFTQTRFFTDPGFSQAASESLYRTWVTNSLDGMADWVLLTEVSGKVAGFITGKVLSTTPGETGQVIGRIELFGVAPEYRGSGVGSGLIECMLREFIHAGCTQAMVITQGANIPAQRVYQRLGFRAKNIQLWYHRWFISE